ncbi:MAG: HEAT repeat domain-containing protein [Phycisphaerales bacterium]|nr:MAG: HEAT repeat domain-containing protein [Phycisphaerales bacterium]
MLTTDQESGLMFIQCLSRLGLAAFILTVTMVAGNGTAQTRSSDDPIQLLDNFVHYTLIARPDLAEGYARQLLDSALSDADLAQMLDEGRVTEQRLDTAISRAQFLPELEDIVGELSTRIEQGRLDLARDRSRINEAIEMLTGTQRQRLLAQRRLLEAGEYAVPHLLRHMIETRDERLRLAAQDLLRDIGLQAVTPLAVALPEIGEARSQRIVCELLGEIGYPHAIPYLRQVADDSSMPQPVRNAAARAMGRLPGDSTLPLDQLYTNLARQYFDDATSLIAYDLEPTNNVWRYDATIGLTPTAVPTVIFGRVMAMKLTSTALDLNPEHDAAIALFVAANLKRQNDLPEGHTDPVYGEAQYSPEFYATVFGTRICMDVLGKALDIQDTPLVRDAVAALSKTTGGANLFAYGEDRQPLIEAIRYADRRVQYETAIVLGRALPQREFPGDNLVVPLLASAVRTGDRLFAAVVGDDDETRQIIGERLGDLRFDIVGSESSVASVRDSIDRSVGVDLVVLRMRSAQRAEDVISELRQIPSTMVVPILVLADGQDIPALNLSVGQDARVLVTRARLTDQAFENSVDQLMTRAAGGRMTQAEADAYAFEALDTLRDIAVSNSPVYELLDAESSLLAAMDTRDGAARMFVADILSMMDSAASQRRLFDAAINADEFDQVELLNHVASSVKRFGDRLQSRHHDALRDLVETSTGSVAEAAAELHGALNRPASTAVDLLPRPQLR